MQPAEVPVYDYVTCTHLAEKRRIAPADVVLFEGVLALHFQQLAPLLNLKVYVDVDDDTRLARRCVLSTCAASLVRYRPPPQDPAGCQRAGPCGD